MSLRQPLFAVVARGRASLLLLSAALVMATAATTSIAAVPVSVDAIEQAGLRRVIAGAPPAGQGIEVTGRGMPDDWTSAMSAIESEFTERLPADLSTLWLARTDSYTIDGRDEAGLITSVASLQKGEGLIRTVDGSMTTDAPRGSIPVWLHADAAQTLDLEVGDDVQLDSRAGSVRVHLIALVLPVDELDPLWFDRRDVRDPATVTGSFTDIGPFMTDPSSFTSLDRSATFSWRGVVDPASVATELVPELSSGVTEAVSTLRTSTGSAPLTITTELPALLAATDVALGATRAVVAVLLVQLVGLALYGLSLAATAVTTTREVDTALLRSRGARASQIGAIAAVEALLVVLPAVVLGPLVATRVVELIGRWGPIAVAGLELDPRLRPSALVGSLLVGILAIVIIVWPALVAARSSGSTSPSRNRVEGPNLLQRTGADLVVAGLAIAGLWRLTRTTVATGDSSGGIGIDPVLVVAPTLGVIAASLITLRIVTVSAAAGQRCAAAGRGLAPALAGWEVARRPRRSSRLAVLVVLSVTVGTFALVQGSTWQRSHQDRANAIVSVDVRAEVARGNAAVVEPLAAARAHAEMPGVIGVAPYAEMTTSFTNQLAAVPTIAVDSVAVGPLLRMRDDLRGGLDDPGGLHRPPDLAAVDLGEPTGDVTVAVDVGRLDSGEPPRSGDGDAGGPDDGVGVTLILVDGNGTLHRLVADRPASIDASTTVTFSLSSPVAGVDVRATGPLRLVGLEVSASIPFDSGAPGSETEPLRLEIVLRDLRVGTQAVDIAVRDWTAEPPQTNPTTVAAPDVDVDTRGTHVVVTLDTGTKMQQRSVLAVSVLPSRRGQPDPGASAELPAVPIAVTDDLLDDLGLQVGDTAVAAIDGTTVTIEIVAAVPAVPFVVESPRAVLVDWGTITAARFALSGRLSLPTGWALGVDAGHDPDRLRATLLAEPLSSREVLDRESLAESFARDPISIGLFAGLALALGTSLLVAVVGLLLSAVVGARERRASYSVLRAMGAPAAHLRRWLLLETVPLISLSVGAGLLAGLALCRVTMTGLTLTATGDPTVPPPVMVVPWIGVGALVAIAVTTGVALPLLTARLLGRTSAADDLRIGDTP